MSFDWYKQQSGHQMKQILQKEAGKVHRPEHYHSRFGSPEYSKDLGDHSFGEIRFLQVDRLLYVGEVSRVNDDYVFHFYRKGQEWPVGFSDMLGDSFLEVFKISDRLSASHDTMVRCLEPTAHGDITLVGCGFLGRSTDLGSPRSGDVRVHCPDCDSVNMTLALDAWSVRAQGFAANPLSQPLIEALFKELDKRLSA